MVYGNHVIQKIMPVLEIETIFGEKFGQLFCQMDFF